MLYPRLDEVERLKQQRGECSAEGTGQERLKHQVGNLEKTAPKNWKVE